MSLKIVNKLADQIDDLKNTEIKMAVSYIQESGVNIILKKMKSKVTEVLFSGDKFMSDPAAIKKLLKNGAKVGMLNEPRFHAKIYIFVSKNDLNDKIAIIGSSNLSSSGWKYNDECNVIIKQPDEMKEVDSIYNGLKKQSIWIKGIDDKIFDGWAGEFKKFENAKQIARDINESNWTKKILIDEILKRCKDAKWKIANENYNYKTGFLKLINIEYGNIKLISVHAPHYKNYKKSIIPITLNSETYRIMKKLSNNSWFVFVNDFDKEEYMVQFNELKISSKEYAAKTYTYHQIYFNKDVKYRKLNIQDLLE